jgi:hypothetical protein
MRSRRDCRLPFALALFVPGLVACSGSESGGEGPDAPVERTDAGSVSAAGARTRDDAGRNQTHPDDDGAALSPDTSSGPDGGSGLTLDDAGDAGVRSAAEGSAGAGAVPSSGIYAEWYSGAPPALPYVVGGQIEIEWGDLEEADGSYNWPALDSLLSAMSLPTTLQINGNKKPSRVYTEVPYAVLSSSANAPECPSSDWSDSEASDTMQVPGSGPGTCLVTPMYWHPVFISEYVALLSAVAQHLHHSSDGVKVIALRQNWDAIGTEHLSIPGAYQSATAAGWIYPSGVAHPGSDWSASVQTAYENQILDAHIQDFMQGAAMVPPVFIRTSLESAVLSAHATGKPAGFTYADYFQSGVLAWFMTSAEMEPRGGGGGAYNPFLAYCATGDTLGLSESWADAWGNHGGQTDVHWATPPQFVYWRLLSDLQLGISYEDVYGNDLDVALNGQYGGKPTTYEAEFQAAFQFAAKYLGHAARPASAPGAWIAFRPEDPGVSSYAVADYAEFVTLLNPTATTGLDARTSGAAVPTLSMPEGYPSDPYVSIGPYGQRFGSWARRIAELQLASTFETHLNTKADKLVNVTYLDDTAGSSFSVSGGGASQAVTLTGSGKWTTAVLHASGDFARGSSGADVTVKANHGAITLHMVEVTF